MRDIVAVYFPKTAATFPVPVALPKLWQSPSRGGVYALSLDHGQDSVTVSMAAV